MEQVNSQRYSRRGFVPMLRSCLQPLLFPDTLNPPKGSRKCDLKNYHPTPPPLKLGCSSQCPHHRSYGTLHSTGEQLRGAQERCGGHGVGRDVCVAPRADSGDSVPLLFSAHRFKLTGGLQSCVLQKDLWVQAYLKRINLCQ